MRRLIVLGTGNAAVTKCYNTCFLLQLETGYFMVDGGGGNGLLVQLERAGVDILQVHHLFVTHAHTDHVLGVVWLIRMVGQKITKYEGDLHIYGHHEVLETIKQICHLTLKKSILDLFGSRIIFQEVRNNESCQILGQYVTFFDIHSTKMKQFGFTLKSLDGFKFTCLGDEPYNPLCEQYVTGSTWLTCEAFCLHSEKDRYKPYEKNHSTACDAAQLAENLSVPNLILWHTEDSYCGLQEAGRKSRYTAEAEKFYHGRVFVPDDLEVIEL